MNETKCFRRISMTVQATDRSYVSVSMTVQPENMIQQPTLKSRANDAIKRLGAPIQILREEKLIANSYAILSPLQRISSPKTLSMIRTAWFIPDDDVEGGDYIFELKRSVYYIYLAQNEYVAEGEVVGINSLVARCNRVASLYRYVDKPTGIGGVTQEFEEIKNNFPIAVEFIRPGIRDEDSGFFKDSTHRCYLPSYLGTEELDRIKIMGEFLKVTAIDRISFDNIHHCSLKNDRRQNEGS